MGFMDSYGVAMGQSGHNFSEDCLSLNIWTKPQSGEKAKAVLLWIYGGAFSVGSTNAPYYNGARLADEEDVIVASVNYRVNIFGFPNAPGLPDQNVALLDQRLAVEWLRDNIAAFGGLNLPPRLRLLCC
jgi:cholinesterase